MGSKSKRRKPQKSESKIRDEIASMAIYIFLAWLKDESYIDNDPKKLIATYEQLQGYFEAVTSHLISVDTIKEIIERDTGAEVRVK